MARVYINVQLKQTKLGWILLKTKIILIPYWLHFMSADDIMEVMLRTYRWRLVGRKWRRFNKSTAKA